MTKLTPLSPIHIGSGEEYENFLLLNGYRYSFDEFLSAVFQNRKKHLLSSTFLKDLISISFSNSGQAKERIREVLTPTKQQIETIPPLYPIHFYFDDSMLKEKDIFAFIKTANQAYLPGSTLKGYIMNVLFFDMIQNDNFIQDYLKNMLEDALAEKINKNFKTVEKTNVMKNFRNSERKVMIAAAHNLICRDVLTHQPLGIYFINRKTKNGSIPQLAECLNQPFTCEGSIVEINKAIHKDNQYEQSIERKMKQSIEGKMTQALVTRINDIPKRFSQMNRAFMKVTLHEQKAFIEKYKQDPELNVTSLMNQLLTIEKMLDEGKIVIQIGKYTNYYSKSVSMGFGKEFFNEMYVDVFRPNFGKKSPKIQTMNLIASEFNVKDFIQIPGYLLIEW